MSTCATCGVLGNQLWVNTGRDEPHPDAFYKLKRLWNRSGTNDTDALLCPECGAWFKWADDTAWTGSGNNDGDTLTRLPPEVWSLFEALLHGTFEGDVNTIVTAMLSHEWQELIGSALIGLTPELRERLVPVMVERLVSTQYDAENLLLYGHLNAYRSRSAETSSRLKALLRRHEPLPPGRAQYLLSLCS